MKAKKNQMETILLKGVASRKLSHFFVGNKLEHPRVKDSVFDLQIGFIGSEELFRNLQHEVNVYLLSEKNWRGIVRSGMLDFVLIESCFSTCNGHWKNAQIGDREGENELLELFEISDKYKTPILFWFTLDNEYFQIFKECAKRFDFIFCADSSSVESFRKEGIESIYLPPAVQPKLFNHLSYYSDEKIEGLNIVADNLADVLSYKDRYTEFLQRLSYYSFHLYDSIHELWQSKTRALLGYEQEILGSVTSLTKQELLKHAEIYVSLTPSDKTSVKQIRLAMEAAASRKPVVHRGAIHKDDPRFDFVLFHEEDDDFFVEIVRMTEDPIYMERIAHKSWRYVMQNHTFSHRIERMCKALSLNCSWQEYPKVSLITPTVRPHFVPRTVEQFDNLLYENKELLIVFNGNYSEYRNCKEKYASRKDLQIHYLPCEKKAGACMNYGIFKAIGEYVFRFDDDDYYGPNYILDYMLNCKIVDADIIGKPAQYWIQNDKNCFFRSLDNYRYNTIFPARKLGFNKIPISGNSIGGKRSIYNEVVFPDTYRAADTAFHLKVNEEQYLCLSTDQFNMLFGRRDSEKHTWEWDHRLGKESLLTIEDLYC
jgi:hypothetical protein